MLKRIIIVLAVCLAIGIIIEILGLIRLRASVASHAHFWKQKSTLKGEFVYVALGDSAAQGVGASEPLKGYVGLLADRIQTTTGKKVRVVNLSVSGAVVQDVLDKQLPELGKYNPDLITVGIGANDVAMGKLDGFPERYETLAQSLPKDTYVSNVPYFGGRLRRNNEALTAGRAIAASAEKYGLRLVNLQSVLSKNDSVRNYSYDFFHPSNSGYRLWADAFWQEIQPNL